MSNLSWTNRGSDSMLCFRSFGKFRFFVNCSFCFCCMCVCTCICLVFTVVLLKVCQTCLKSLSAVTARCRCPVCRQLITQQRNVFMEQTAELAQFECAYRSFGCTEEIGLGFSAFAAHRRVCQFVVGAVPCQVSGCKLKHLPDDLLTHWQAVISVVA